MDQPVSIPPTHMTRPCIYDGYFINRALLPSRLSKRPYITIGQARGFLFATFSLTLQTTHGPGIRPLRNRFVASAPLRTPAQSWLCCASSGPSLPSRQVDGAHMRGPNPRQCAYCRKSCPQTTVMHPVQQCYSRARTRSRTKRRTQMRTRCPSGSCS